MYKTKRERAERGFQEAVLAETETLWLSFNTEAAPYVIPVNHVFHNKALYIHCAVEGQKLELLRRDPRVGFATATDIEIVREKNTTRYRSVCGTGRAVIVESEPEMQEALAAISRRFQATCTLPVPAAVLNKVKVIRIDIESLMGKEA